jgi:ABC-type multidrug transport system fused ATPase/permease subunit
METNELLEVGEKARSARERQVGLTMAVTAALLAVVTLMGHRLHTEEVILQTKATDGWAYFQAKNGRYHMYTVDAKLAELNGAAGHALAEEWKKKGEEERSQSEDIRKANETLEEETQAAARKATFFDGAEICLEVAIVLCSIALLTGTRLFWRLSFVGSAIGVAIAAFGVF